jgi:hypothetical protein
MGEHKLDRVKSHGWEEITLPLDNANLKMLRDAGVKTYRKGACGVFVGREPRPGASGLHWHMSISCANRYPTWEEISDARYSLLPLGLTFAQILPPLNEYVSVHPNCFHLWEIPWVTP